MITKLDRDDRLVADSLYFTPETIRQGLGNKGFYEVSRRYKAKTLFTSYDYRLHFRVLKQ
jgi:hypothetical protein